MVLTPVLAYSLLHPETALVFPFSIPPFIDPDCGNYHTTLAILATYIPFSDWLDGHLARKHGMGTQLGSFLDPAADKFFMFTMSLTLFLSGKVDGALYPEVLSLWMTRDVFLMVMGATVLGTNKASNMLLGQGGATITASPLSKYNSVIQFFTLGTSTGLLAYYGGCGVTPDSIWLETLVEACGVASVFTTVGSAYGYVSGSAMKVG